MEISGFRIKRRIAEGGMASVHLAVQESLGRHVALKLLKKFDRPQDSERFLNEGRVIAALNHPNIITIHDIGFDGERPFIAMEYLEGGSLQERIERGMAVEAALDIVIAISACLEFVHRRGLVHRDVKPANILFHANGTPKLTDFGIAKSLALDSELTLDGSALGSPFYLSPEQAQNQPLDGRADIYSLGIIFYEMLTGEKPHRADSHIETILSQLTNELPALPPELALYREALELMTAKDPEERFSSAGEMLGYFRALRRFASAGVPARVPSPAVGGERRIGRQWLWDRRLALGAGAALSLATLAWIAGGWDGSHEPQPRVSLEATMPRPVGGGLVSPHPAPVSQPEPSTNEAPQPEVTLPAPKILQDESGPASVGAGWESAAVTGANPETADSALSLPTLPIIGVAAAGDEAAVPSDSSMPVEGDAEMGGESQTDGLTAAIMPDERLGNGPPTGEAASGENAQNEGFGVPRLLELAAQAMAEYRLTIPPQDSALHYFEAVLKLEPGQPQAEQGMDRIAERYADLAGREISQQAYAEAERYLQRGLQVRPGHPPLLELQRALEARRLELAAAEARRRSEFEVPEPPPSGPPISDGGSNSIFQH